LTNSTRESGDLAPVQQVAAATRAPVRTIYRWIRDGKLKSRKVDGRAMVSQQAVLTLLATRRISAHRSAPVAAPSVAGNRADNPATGTAVAQTRIAAAQVVNVARRDPTTDGEFTAKVFDLLVQGKSAIEVVQILQAPADHVRAIHQQYRFLLEPHQPTWQEELGELGKEFAELKAERTKDLADLDSLSSRVDLLGNRVLDFLEKVRDLDQRLSLLEKPRR
jgi:excisionase family DNA binding protein